jgi:hypothetical protein
MDGLLPGFETINVRMSSSGHPECASINGKKCLRATWGLVKGAKTCGDMAARLNRDSKAAGQPLVPLQCGPKHLQAWTITGYDQPGHWCNVAREYFQDYQQGMTWGVQDSRQGLEWSISCTCS